MKRLLFSLLIGIITISCTPGHTAQTPINKGTKEIQVKVVETKPHQTISTILTYSGLTTPTVTVPLSFQLPGRVAFIKAEEGSTVKKGQVIAELNKASFQNSYNAALASQKQAQDAYERLKRVYDNGSLPEIKWEEVKAKLQQANSLANIAKENLTNCTIHSPINGVISSRNIEVGSSATPGITAFKVVSIDEIDVKISVPDNEINQIRKNQAANVNFPALGDSSYKATVEKIGISANTISKTFEVKARINNKDQLIKPGMVCEIELPLQNNTAGLLIPIQSVMKDEQSKNYVFVVDQKTNSAKRKDIKSSGILNNQLCVSDGLNPGELLVIEGQHKLSEDAKVHIN